MRTISTRSLAPRLQALHDVRAQLFCASSADELCRRAVELGRERLGFYRLSIWLAQSTQEARGSYGTDEFGKVRDERQAHVAVAPTSAMGRIFLGDTDLLLEAKGSLHDETGAVIGQGTHILAAMWDSLQVVGVLSADDLLSKKPYCEEDGEILRLYAVIIGHIYQQLLSEEARQQAVRQCADSARALRDSEHDLHTFFESMPDIAVVTTPQGNILYVNSAAEHLLGYSAEELVAKPVLEWHPPALRGEAEVIFASMIRGEQSQCLLPLMAQDGTLIPVKTRVWLGTWHGTSCVYAIIKDRRETQEAEQRFEQIFRQNPSPIAISQVEDSRFIDVNEAFLAMTGYARHEVIGQTAADLQLFPDATQQEQYRQQLRTTGHIDQVEMLVRQKDGSLRTGLFTGDHVMYLDRPHLLTVMVDITERKRAEESLLESEQRLDFAIRSTHAGVWDLDVRSNHMTWDDRMLELYGLTRETFAGGVQAWENGLHPQDRANAAAEREKALEGDQSFDTEFRVVRPNGETRTIKSDGLVLRDADGTPGRMIGLNRDITDRQEAVDALRESEQRHRDYITNTPYGVFVVNETGQYLQVNPAACRLTGYSEQELLAMSIADIHPAEAVEAGLRHFQTVIREGRAHNELPFQQKSGTQRWWSASAVKLSDTRYLGFCHDITERKQAELELRQSEEKFELLFKNVPVGYQSLDEMGRI